MLFLEIESKVSISQLDTPEFKRWFGKSHVVDSNGKPLIVYKSMYPYDVKSGKPIKSIRRPSELPSFNQDEPGVHVAGFFGSKDVANRFSTLMPTWPIYPVYLSFQNPYKLNAKGRFAGEIQFEKSGKEFREAIRSGKYDSVIIYNTKDEGDVYVALKPGQIKSAIGNKGTFSRKSSDINENR